MFVLDPLYIATDGVLSGQPLGYATFGFIVEILNPEPTWETTGGGGGAGTGLGYHKQPGKRVEEGVIKISLMELESRTPIEVLEYARAQIDARVRAELKADEQLVRVTSVFVMDEAAPIKAHVTELE